MDQAELEKYKGMLEAKQAELSMGLRNRDDIVIEKAPDALLYAVKVFGDPKRIHVTPDCGLRTRSWTIAYEKLKNMTAGVALARKELGL